MLDHLDHNGLRYAEQEGGKLHLGAPQAPYAMFDASQLSHLSY